LHWPAVAAAAVVALALVASAVAWAAAYPRNDQRPPAEPEPLATAVLPTTAPRPAPEPPVRPLPVPQEARPAPSPVPAQSAEPQEDVECAAANYGTGVTFLSDPAVAGRRAAKAGRLLLVLHISGNFEDSGFT
jgi:hypothetical protein